jgi:four helix bundle protein
VADIDITERAFSFACRVVKLCKSMENDSRVSWVLANQLLRSATSIGANLEEAQSGQSKADFTAKVYISCKEARETLYWLRLLIKTEIIPENKLSDLADEAKQLVAILTTITKTAKAKQ